MTQKLYCYVDESGQDTLGELLIVSVLVVAEEKEMLERLLEKIEQETGKSYLKWSKNSKVRRRAYMERVLEIKLLREKLMFAIHRNTLDYLEITAQTIAKTFARAAPQEYRAIVLIDALPSAVAIKMGAQLRRRGVHVKKVKGVRREENDALMRLVDAVCGLVRDARSSKRL